MKPLILNPGREKRILLGHKWIFSNEIAEPLAHYEAGSWVEAFSSKGASLGCGYINPHSLIAVRLLTGPGKEPTTDLLAERLRKADALRRNLLYPGSRCYRAVYGESDGLPGLVVDRYDNVLVYQINTLGMSIMENTLQEALLEVFKPEALVFRNDSSIRRLEGLPPAKGIAYGSVPEDLRVEVDGIRYRLDPLEGQKTGMYLDQRDNRQSMKLFAGKKRVLDLFCYNGAWSLAAATAGATEVLGIDESRAAIQQAADNAQDNGLASVCRFEAKEVFQALKDLPRSSFDLVVVDPPAFVKTKSALVEAKRGYTDLNRRALLTVKPGGILISCSCSYHLDEIAFRDILIKAGQASGRELKLLEARGQAKDHPILLAMPEMRYLKCFILEVG